MISQTVEYGLRAIVHLAMTPKESQTTEQIAESTQVPQTYLSKVLQTLGRSEIVKSHPGPKGGFRLLSDPARLTVLEVVNAIEPLERITQCPLRLSAHTGALCPLHLRLDMARGLVEDAFRQCKIADLIGPNPHSKPLCGPAENAG